MAATAESEPAASTASETKYLLGNDAIIEALEDDESYPNETVDERTKSLVASSVGHDSNTATNVQDRDALVEPSEENEERKSKENSPLKRVKLETEVDDKIIADSSYAIPKIQFPISPTEYTCLDRDVASVDLILYRVGRLVIITWLFLIALSYYLAPPESIVMLEGTERSAAQIELGVLSVAVIIRHAPMLSEMTRENESYRMSGVLVGGLTVQFVAIATMAWMVSLPVPVMIDPVFLSRVHLLRWCEWTPLAGYMTLLTLAIDAPIIGRDGGLSQPWKEKFTAAGMEAISTLCGFLFPFCPNVITWTVCMVVSCATYALILVSYVRKKAEFQKKKMGRSEDDIELYERARMSLGLHWMCCVTWTGITVAYFISSAGHLVTPESYTWLHDPAITMIEECIMDSIAKIMYMNLIVEAHNVAFDETKRTNRRLAELRNTMNVVWENSSDTIAISVLKISGTISSMISPSFFRDAFIAKEEKVADISAIILDVVQSSLKKRVDSFTNVISRIQTGDLPQVGMRIIRKKDFPNLDFHSEDSTNFFVTASQKMKPDLTTLCIVTFTDILSRAWHTKTAESIFEHDVLPRDGIEGPRLKYEVKVTKLDKNAIIVTIRDVSERYRRFEAEKRNFIETTARQKDAEANRFTKHEVKNGLLEAIEICGNIRAKISEDFSKLSIEGDSIRSSNYSISEQSMAVRVESITELDKTLHGVLDMVLADTMARDVIHGLYEPNMNRIDINNMLSQTRGFNGQSDQFCLISSPSPLPVILSDQGLFKCIHGNAIRNALKYGRPGGKITTEATYSAETGMFEMNVINLPGPGHQSLVDLGSRASDLVFSQHTRLHKDAEPAKQSLSAGDGAWIIRKCATILAGTVDIYFEPERTVFVFKAPIKLYDTSQESFTVPQDVWGIAIDDSKIQRKLLCRFFVHAGVHEHRQIILGQNANEISNFVDFIVDFVKRNPGDRLFIIVDENLELGDDSLMKHATISGSMCIRKIRTSLEPEDEKRILALVRSASDSKTDVDLFLSRAHGYMPKVPLRAIGVKEMVAPLWKKRFPDENEKVVTRSDKARDRHGVFTRITSLENFRDLSLVSSTELIAELQEIDEICMRDIDEINIDDRWHVLWDKLHQLKGDLKSANIDEKYSETIDAIESLRGQSAPPDFFSRWLKIRARAASGV